MDKAATEMVRAIVGKDAVDGDAVRIPARVSAKGVGGGTDDWNGELYIHKDHGQIQCELSANGEPQARFAIHDKK